MGGVRIDLGRFFRITGVVLVLVAAGLLSSVVHSAREGRWWNVLLDQAVDLGRLIRPGPVASALITGMFGIQPEPTVGGVLVWFAYAVPMTAFALRGPYRDGRDAVQALGLGSFLVAMERLRRRGARTVSDLPVDGDAWAARADARFTARHSAVLGDVRR